MQFADPTFFVGRPCIAVTNWGDFSGCVEFYETINYTDCEESATDLKPLNCNPLQKSALSVRCERNDSFQRSIRTEIQ